MASPSMANRTRISRAIRTMAWPCCSLCSGELVRILGTVDRITGDDDPAANNLLDQRSQRLEVEPERHLDGLVADSGLDAEAARSWRGRRAASDPPAGTVRDGGRERISPADVRTVALAGR